MTFVEAVTLLLLDAIATGLRMSTTPRPRPRSHSWPRPFRSRAAWLAWCEQDRADERFEILAATWDELA